MSPSPAEATLVRGSGEEDVGQDVDVVDHQVLHDRGPGDPGGGRIVPLQLDVERLLHDLPDLPDDRVEPLDLADPDRESAWQTLEQPLALLHGRADRLLDQHGHAGLDHPLGRLEVVRGRHADADRVRGLEERLERARDGRADPPGSGLGRLLPHVVDQHLGHLLELGGDPEVVLAHHPGADHADPHGRTRFTASTIASSSAGPMPGWTGSERTRRARSAATGQAPDGAVPL